MSMKAPKIPKPPPAPYTPQVPSMASSTIFSNPFFAPFRALTPAFNAFQPSRAGRPTLVGAMR